MPPDHGNGEGNGPPDYRFTLANERTFLAWIRTSLALLAGGIALHQIVRPFGVRGVRTGLAVTAVVLSLVIAVSSYVRWTQVERAMRRGEPLPRALGVQLLTVAIAAMAGTVVLVLLLP